MKPLTFTSPITLRASGKARRFKILAYSGGLLRVDGFQYPVVVDLSGLEANAVSLILDHTATTDNTIGMVETISNNGRSLVLAGIVTGQSQRVRDVLAAADNGQEWQASIGCVVEAQDDIPAGQSAIVNGQRFSGPVVVARRSVLKETSVLPIGADSTTTVNLAARAALLKGSAMSTPAPAMTFDEWLTEHHIDPSTVTPELKTLLVPLFDAENSTTPAPAAAAAVIDLRATAAAESNRISQINSICAGRPEIAAAAIARGWSAIETENHVLKASQRMNAPSNFRTTSDAGTTADHLTAALMVKAGYSAAAEKTLGGRVMEQSKSLHGASLPDLCAAALRLDGREVPSERGQMIRAALSTGSLPTALGDSANKILVSAYQQAPASWRSFAAVKPAANFKTQTGIRPTFGGDLSQLPPGGLIHHGSYGEETYSWSVNTFAKQFQIDRRDIINDDASVFSDVVPGLARASARTLNGLVATTLLANAGSFFGSGNSNYFDGAGTTLSATSLATAIQMLRQMKDAEGNLLDLAPAVLLVPPELEQTALALIRSSEVARVSTGDQLPTGNTFKDIAAVAVEPRLSDAGFSGYSTTAWYLFSDASNAAAVVGFLDGKESPTLETFGLDHDINTLAYGFRVYHDFGCALADYRAAIKSKGAA